jgi:glutaredoxin
MIDPDIPETVVEVYWRPACRAALRAPLRRSGLPVREINIWDDPQAAARVRSVAGGNETVPTVFVGSHAMVNPEYGAGAGRGPRPRSGRRGRS